MFLLKLVPKLKNKQRLDKILSILLFGYSRSKIKKMILDRCVMVNNLIVDKPRMNVLGGEQIKINVESILKQNKPIPQNIPLNVIYDDQDIIIVNKSSGMVVHPGAGNLDNTLLNALLFHYPEIKNLPRSGIIHRLDKDTTGLILVARNEKAFCYLLNLMKLRKIDREYNAIVIGNVSGIGTINQPISRHPINRTYMTVNPTGKSAITYYQAIKTFEAYTYLHVYLGTGRTHQIRVHMAHIKYPILGDKLYCKCPIPIKNTPSKAIDAIVNLNRQALHATTLRFYHPTTKKIVKYHVAVPLDMKRIISALI